MTAPTMTTPTAAPESAPLTTTATARLGHLLAQRLAHPDGHRLRRVGCSSYLEWTGRRYAPIDSDEVARLALDHVRDVFREDHCERQALHDVLAALGRPQPRPAPLPVTEPTVLPVFAAALESLKAGPPTREPAEPVDMELEVLRFVTQHLWRSEASGPSPGPVVSVWSPPAVPAESPAEATPMAG